MRKLSCYFGLGFLLSGCAWFGPSNPTPQVYKPTYTYGATPMGVYMGNPYDLGEDMVGGDMYMPDGQPMTEYQAQSGQQEQQFQYIQGQETLMHDRSEEQLNQYNQEQKLSESMDQEYLRQIDRQKHQQAESPIILPKID